MRKLVWVALAALVALLFFLLIYGSGKSDNVEAKAAQNDVSFGIYSSELADSGSATVAVLQTFLFSPEGGDVFSFCSPLPLQENIIILDHPASPGTDALLADKIASALSKCGFSSRRATLEDALSSKNAVIVSPTGAVPEALSENAAALEGNNDRVIVLQSLPGRGISAEGKLKLANGTAQFEIVELKKGDEEAASAEAARLVLLPKSAGAEQRDAFEGNYTEAVPVFGSRAYCRAVYLSSSYCRHAESGELVKPEGSLIGPEKVLAGKKEEFEFSLNGSSEVGRSLKFYAVSCLGKNEVGKTEMPGGTISEGWASRFPIEFPSGGKYVVRAVDQFGRLHAAAYVQAMGLEVSEVSHGGSRREFYVLFGSEPAEGPISVWIDNGEKKEYGARNGTLVVWAAPSAGSHTMHFSHNGLVAAHGFAAESGGLLETYVRLGVPAAVFLVAVYFLFRAGRKAKYCITFPQFAEMESVPLVASGEDVARAWKEADRKRGGFSLVLYPEEIGGALLSLKGRKQDGAMNSYSVLRALRKLCAEGKFSESAGAFVPVKELRGFSAGELWVMRLIHDCMLERGLKFERKPVVRVRGGELELALFRGKESVLGKIGERRRAVIFESRQAQSGFERSLSEPSLENVRIKLALANGKIIFATAVRSEIEGLLP